MYILSIEQIKQIERDVAREQITFSHLQHDLIDHLCCDVEERILKGLSFEDAYHTVKENIGDKGLKSIQQDTLLLIDKNYRMMKKSMKSLGVIALALMAIAALFKLQHWPGAGAMMGLGFLMTCFVFFPAMLYTMYKEVSSKKQSYLYILAFLGGLLFMLGILFKVQHWPGAHIVLSVGSGILLLIFIPVYLFSGFRMTNKLKSYHAFGVLGLFFLLLGLIFKINHWPGAAVILYLSIIVLSVIYVPMYYIKEVRNSEKVRTDFLFGLIAMIYVILLTTMMSLNSSRDNLSTIAMQNAGFIENAEQFYTLSYDLQPLVEKEKLNELNHNADILYKKIEGIKIDIIRKIDEVNIEIAKERNKDLDMVNMRSKNAAFLLSENNSNAPLKGLLGDFQNYSNSVISLQSELKINTEPFAKAFSNHFADQQKWEAENIGYLPALNVINNLSLWQYKLRMTQYMVLAEIQNTNLSNQ